MVCRQCGVSAFFGKLILKIKLAYICDVLR